MTIGFTATLQRKPVREDMIEFPIQARSFTLGDPPTREEVAAMSTELLGYVQTSERVVQDLERDSQLEIYRINSAKSDMLSPLVGRVRLRWEAAKKQGVEFSVTLTFGRRWLAQMLRERASRAYDLEKPEDLQALGRLMWCKVYEPEVRTMTLRELVRQEMAK